MFIGNSTTYQLTQCQCDTRDTCNKQPKTQHSELDLDYLLVPVFIGDSQPTRWKLNTLFTLLRVQSIIKLRRCDEIKSSITSQCGTTLSTRQHFSDFQFRSFHTLNLGKSNQLHVTALSQMSVKNFYFQFWIKSLLYNRNIEFIKTTERP